MSALRIDAVPTLRDPVLVAAFKGWNDAGNAATIAAGFLRSRFEAEPIATIDADDYVDFQQTRPRVSLDGGEQRHIEWPDTEFHAATIWPGGRGLVVCSGTEPNLRWRAFAADVLRVADAVGARLVVTLGGLLADTPHSRPIPVSGSAYSQATIDRLGLQRSRYEGPTGIVGVLHDACGRAGLESVSLWAAVPHYIGGNPNPSAALALVQSLGRLLDVDLDPDELRRASAEFDRQVATQVEGDAEIASYVRDLEQAADEDDGEGWSADAVAGEEPLPSGDDLEQDIQRFLRERRTGDAPEPPRIDIDPFRDDDEDDDEDDRDD